MEEQSGSAAQAVGASAALGLREGDTEECKDDLGAAIDEWERLQARARHLASECNGLWVEPAPMSERQLAAQDLLAWGFPPQYAGGVDMGMEFEDFEAEDSFQGWLQGLQQRLKDGGWLLLCGGVGVGKTMGLARMALALRSCVPGRIQVWPYWQGRGCQPVWENRGWLPEEVRYVLAPDLAAAMLQADRRFPDSDVGLSESMIARTRVLFVDDVDRWLQMSPYDRDLQRVLYHWDTLAEIRNGPGWITAVTANRPVAELAQMPQFAQWVDRVRGNGLALDIPGDSRRGRAQ